MSPKKTSDLGDRVPRVSRDHRRGAFDDHLKARISMDGKVSEVREVGLEELRAALDEAAKFVSENGIR